ncbi:MAG: DUF4418 family protein [Thermoleophilia bacterium]
MKKSTRIGIGAGVIALGGIIAITPRFLFPVCEYNGIFMQLANGRTDYMHCHYTTVASYLLAGIIGLIGTTILFARERETTRLLSVVLAGAAAAVILTPIVFPVCQNLDDPCNHGTKPMLIVMGIITFFMAGWLRAASRKTHAAYSSKSVSDTTQPQHQ